MVSTRLPTLARQLLGPLVLLGLVLAGLTIFAGWRQMNHQLDTQLADRTRTVARALRFAAESADSRESMIRLARMLVAGGDVDLICITGGRPPRVMISSRPQMQGTPVSQLADDGIDAGATGVLRGDRKEEYLVHHRELGRLVYAARLSANLPETHPLANGAVLIELPTRALQASITAATLWTMGGVLLLGAVGVGGFVWLLRIRVLRPLTALANEAGAGGAVTAPESAAREIAVLAASLNRALAEVAELNRGLEQRVRDRTRELAASLERERDAGRLKVNFLGMISHEFRNTLGLVLSSTQILARYGERLEAPERARHLAKIEASCHRLSSVVEDTLFYSRSEGGRIALHLAPIDLPAFCQAEARAAEPAVTDAAMARIRFSSEAGAPVTVTTDESLLRHTLANLLSNALKYSDAAAPVRFTLGPAKPGFFSLGISDRGIGIPAEEQAHLGEPFWRGTNVGPVQGTGLGLVIVRRCLDLLGGELHCDSSLGAGTRLTVTLPLHPASA